MASRLRAFFALRPAPKRWPFALRAALCMAVPVLAGVLAGDAAAGLMATIGAFTALYGGRRPYAYRAVMLACIAVGLALAVGLGLEASRSQALALATVTLIAMAATLLCRALNTGPPGAYLFVLACAAGTAMPAAHITPVHAAALVLAGGAFSWIAHMAGALFKPREPETTAVLLATREVAAFIRALGTPAQDKARHAAAFALHDAWAALVTFQPLQRASDGTVAKLRSLNRELHQLFAEAVAHASRNQAMPDEALKRARRVAELARNPSAIEVQDEAALPLGRVGPVAALREALQPGSMALLVVLRVGVASVAAGTLAAAMSLEHAYWSIAAAVLVLHYGFDWRRTVQRGFERLIGTWLGLLITAPLLAWHPQGLWLVAAIGGLQFVIEMLVLRNYGVAVIFITAVALLIATGGSEVENYGELLLARGLDTTAGCLIGIAVFALMKPRGVQARMRREVEATLDALAAVLTHFAQGHVASEAARRDRRDLQHRLFALNEAYEGGVGGTARERRETEEMWPAVASAQRLAYRVLAECWAVERGGAVPSTAPFEGELEQLRETLAPESA